MDGLVNNFPMQANLPGISSMSGPLATDYARTAGYPASLTTQRTLKTSIDAVGHGVHSGQRARVTLHPAAPGAGIVFRRSDLDPPVDIAARFDQVIETRLCTMLGAGGVRISTVEHLMAALSGAGIDNVLVEVDGPEIPIFDGSADPFLFLIDCAGVLDQGVQRQVIQVLRPVRVEHGDSFVELRPGAAAGTELEMALAIDFKAAAIGRQALSLTVSEASFRSELGRARTFALAADIAQMQASGLALGGTLDNAVIVDEATVVNPGGLRMPDEFVRHKLLDAVGDLALAGGRLSGRYIGHKAGHRMNNAVLRALFADHANWRLTGARSGIARSGWAPLPQTAAA